MCEDLLASTDVPALTELAHRLGWYFVGAPPEPVDTLDATLKRVSDDALMRLLRAAARPFRADRPEDPKSSRTFSNGSLAPTNAFGDSQDQCASRARP